MGSRSMRVWARPSQLHLVSIVASELRHGQYRYEKMNEIIAKM